MISFSVTFEDEVSSTNECIKHLIAQGAPEGTVVRARCQRSGYGRRGHGWASPEGGLYLSVLLRPEERAGCAGAGGAGHAGYTPSSLGDLPTLSLVAGLAVRRGVCQLVSPEAAKRVKVKWPNDVLVTYPNGSLRKLCGISLEGAANALCLGIGVNVQPVEGRACVQDLADVSVDEVAASVLRAFAELYEQWLVNPFAIFLEEYDRVNALTGRVVSVQLGDERVEGAFAGADEAGRMLLRLADGTVRAISSGEAHIERMA